MKTKKPDRAAKIAEWTHTWHPAAFKGAMFDLKLARAIRRAIADAVKVARADERGMCIDTVQLLLEYARDRSEVRALTEVVERLKKGMK